MDDLVRLLNLLADESVEKAEADPPLAVATVVNTRGSAYRRPGARMLVRRSLAVSGAVSAGCLERDIIARCEGMQPGDPPLLLTYDGSSPDELVFGLKLGCDGVVQILVEPVGDLQKFESLAAQLPALLAEHHRVAAVTLFDMAPCTGHLASPEISALTGLVMVETGLQTQKLVDLPDSIADLLAREARAALLEGRQHSCVIRLEQDGYVVSALIEIVEPTTALLIFGSGQDVQPLADMAAVLGWGVTVRSSSQVDRLDLADLSEMVGHAPFSAAVVMSHDYDRDRKILQALLSARAIKGGHRRLPYIGVVGPRRRSEKLLAELALAGVPLTDDELGRIYSPVGLDIGAERPEEIALSIVAEIKAVLAGHGGGLLRDKQGPIHQATRVKTSTNLDPLVNNSAVSISCGLDDV
jgi:xanthine/CO dehydrogenase XdhC/CoxF family maturation factor